MSTMGPDIAKAGWLYRRSSFLRRWKKNWVVLYQDGLLRYFESPNSSRAEEVFIMRSACKRIKTGSEVGSVTPPDEVRGGNPCLFELEMTDGNHLLLCAESDDDMKAWHFSLEEARTMQPPGPSMAYPSATPIGYTYERVPFGGYQGQVIRTPPPQVYQTAHGTTTVINQPPQQMVMEDDVPDRYRHRYGRRNCGTLGTVYVATPRYF